MPEQETEVERALRILTTSNANRIEHLGALTVLRELFRDTQYCDILVPAFNEAIDDIC